MRIFWYGSIFGIIGALTALAAGCFDLYIDNWLWWAIVIPLVVLIGSYICWRDEKIKKEALERFNNGK
jgi:hypothetical protein